MSSIVYQNGVPFIEIHGELFAPAAFRSFRPKPDNLSLISRAGVRLCQMLVSGLPCTIGTPYSLFGGVWKGEGVYDFAPFDRQYEMFRLFAPDAYYNVMLQLDVPEWWKDAHPDLPQDSYHHITDLALCEEWKRAAADYLKAFITYAEEKYGDRIFGYSIAAGLSNEWFDRSLYEADYDREGTYNARAYRELIGDPNAPLPTMDSMEAGESSLRDPDTNDFKYLKLCCDSTADLVCFFAHEAQEVLRHEKLLGLFYGYTDMGNQVYWNTNAYEKAWKSPDIDMLYSPAAYGVNRELSGVSSYQYTVDSIALHGKLYLHENDHRTHLARFPLENGAMLTDCYDSFEEWREVFRRELCNVMQKRSAFWWFDFFGGYYSSPEYEAELKLETELFNRLAAGARESTAEIAVFIDPMSFNCTRQRTELCLDLGRLTVDSLLRCGAPFDLFNQNDLELIDLGKYKMYVFLNGFLMTEAQRRLIRERLRDRLVVFTYGVGMEKDGRLDIRNTAALCGLNVEEIDSSRPLTASYEGVQYGFSHPIHPLFAVRDEAAEPLSRYENGEVCAALKENRVYCALGRAPWQMWRDLARRAGVHVYSEQGSGTAVCSQFVAAYTTLTEDCELHMKEDGAYRELFSGARYETRQGLLRYHAGKGQTMLFVKE